MAKAYHLTKIIWAYIYNLTWMNELFLNSYTTRYCNNSFSSLINKWEEDIKTAYLHRANSRTQQKGLFMKMITRRLLLKSVNQIKESHIILSLIIIIHRYFKIKTIQDFNIEGLSMKGKAYIAQSIANCA